MTNSQNLINAIVNELDKSVQNRGLKLEKRDIPVSSGYSQEWVIQDTDGWNYAGFGVRPNGGYQYTLVSSASLPFDAKETINWIGSGIEVVINPLSPPTVQGSEH